MPRLLTAACLATLVATRALSQPATPEGADSLRAAMQKYLGTTDGIVTVVPDADSYLARIDVAPLVAKVALPDVAFTMSTIELSLSELGDNRWQVSQEGPLSISFALAPMVTARIEMDQVAMSGVFDANMGSFEAADGTINGIKLHEVMLKPGAPKQTIDYTVETLRSSMTTQPGAAGGVDAVMHYQISGFQEAITTEPPGGQPFTVTVTTDTQNVDSVFVGLKSREQLDLLAYLVAHPSKEALLADEAGLKAALSAALPMFESFKATGAASNVAAQTPFGDGGVTGLGVEVEANGLVTDGRLREKFTFSGLTLPEAILPPWLPPLLPKEGTVDLAFSGFDAGAAARLAIEAMSIAGKPQPDFAEKFAAALLPDSRFHLTLGPSGFAGGDYQVDLDADLDITTEGRPPVGKATLAVTGMDAILKSLNEAPRETAAQVVPPILMARGLARTKGDKLVWEMESTSDGKVTINGKDISGLVGR